MILRMTNADATAIRESRRRRARMIRRRVTGGMLALFVATWLLITLLLVTGHDPALARLAAAQTAAQAAGAQTAGTSSGLPTSSTGSTSFGATSSNTAGSSSGISSSSGSGVSSVTSTQS
jgi:hypothetical protein